MTRTSQITPASFFEAVRAATPSRVGLGRRGDSLPTSALLELREAHAVARDAIHLPLDVDRLCRQIREVPELARLGDPLVVRSMAADRSQYLRRPDLGRRLDPSCRTEVQAPVDTGSGSGRGSEGSGSDGRPSLAIVIADGLSTAAVAAHAVPVARALVAELGEQFRLAPLVVASQARVAIGDEIGVGLGVGEVIVLIGERPGLSVSDSLGGYLTHGPRPGRRDSERNCVSNIRPDGLSYRLAAATLARLARGAMELGCSGVSLKDDGGQIDGPDRGEIGPAGADRQGRSEG
ncbi:ethanolamine ammonia-lyase subunit EutC [Acidipropionibacterium jensenii]|uniref:Ethanolamine ammonia-lyase small subunit n=1 Tax=Acidipropionibacterium jensenii TaxID=1749 RepID=A0A3T0RXI8_9ACTN|nr:ethanolamine ammonia-lyase subunit EutC [Acidipropionibacterium jensenii]AZZ38856.1 ethanolamine ammonia-lyase subunit EutC [Acidipropionibacterium jensenii]